MRMHGVGRRVRKRGRQRRVMLPIVEIETVRHLDGWRWGHALGGGWFYVVLELSSPITAGRRQSRKDLRLPEPPSPGCMREGRARRPSQAGDVDGIFDGRQQGSVYLL